MGAVGSTGTLTISPTGTDSGSACRTRRSKRWRRYETFMKKSQSEPFKLSALSSSPKRFSTKFLQHVRKKCIIVNCHSKKIVHNRAYFIK